MSNEATEDLNLPLSVVNRLIKDALPPGHMVAKDARLAIARAASVFVLYCTHHASAQAVDQSRKTLKDIDVFHGLKEMELDVLIPDVQKATEEYKKQRQAKKVAKVAKATNGGVANTTNGGVVNEEVTAMEVETKQNGDENTENVPVKKSKVDAEVIEID